eukprot:1161294-Pelagomonas_calceolata.AAC.4
MDLNLQKKGAGEHFEKVCEKGVLEGAAAGPHPAKDQADMRTKIACVSRHLKKANVFEKDMFEEGVCLKGLLAITIQECEAGRHLGPCSTNTTTSEGELQAHHYSHYT